MGYSTTIIRCLISPAELAGNADAAASELLDLLGWRHACTGPKGKPFEDVFQVLGCQVDLRKVSSGELKLENKMGRVEKLHDMLGSLKVKRSVSLHESQVLHGLLRFASGFFAGRQLHQVCAETIALCRGGTFRSHKLVELRLCRCSSQGLQTPCSQYKLRSTTGACFHSWIVGRSFCWNWCSCFWYLDGLAC